MKKTLEDIERALVSIDRLDEESKAAIGELSDAIEIIERHPIGDEVRCKLAGAATGLNSTTTSTGNETETDSASGQLTALQKYLDETMKEHPTVSLAIGRLANALAVAGL